MKWNKITIKTTTDAVDFVSGILMDLGIEEIEIVDNVELSKEDKEKMFIDILPKLPKNDGTAFIHFYLPQDSDMGIITALEKKLVDQKAFVDMGDMRISISTTEESDWVNNWKKYFKPFTVDGILIKPTWESVQHDDKGKMIIEIDPGTAFGTGLHETTRLCIRQLKKLARSGCKVLDIGCGSGILTIIASKLGAAQVTAIDVDEKAVIATRENLVVNGIDPESVGVILGNLLEDKNVRDNLHNQCYDVVVANILADVIVPLTGIIGSFMKPNGIYITSGIIFSKEETVANAIRETENLEIMEITRDGDWVSITAKKN